MVVARDVRTDRASAVMAGVCESQRSIGIRALARKALRSLPAPDWAVRGGMAYAATRAVGEAAIRRFSATAEDPTQPRASAASAAR